MTEPFNLEPQSGEKIWITGDTVTIRATAADTGGAYTMIESTASPGNGPPLHLHRDEDETLYVLEGDIEITNGDQVLKGKPGAVAFVPKGVAHRFRGTGERIGRILIVYTPGGIEGFFREAGRPATGEGPAPPFDSDELARSIVAGRRYGLEAVNWGQ